MVRMIRLTHRSPVFSECEAVGHFVATVFPGASGPAEQDDHQAP
jgi:hypothetical protein